MKTVKRYVYIDYLKVIGLLLIILAHVKPNPYFYQLRCFDVPLMVVVSGFLAYDSYKRSNQSILSYYFKRISRLVFPTWIFLIIYFAIFYFIAPYNFDEIIRSFLLLDGIGYVWIIRIYLICAFLTPIIVYFNEYIKSSKIKIISLIIIYLSYEVFVYLKFNEANIFTNFIIAYLIPYGIVYIIGMLSKNRSTKFNLKLSLIFLVVFIISLLSLFYQTGALQQITSAKYPPTVLFISYGLFASFLLLSVLKSVNLKEYKIISFISRSSLWIYLWHILFLNILPEAH